MAQRASAAQESAQAAQESPVDVPKGVWQQPVENAYPEALERPLAEAYTDDQKAHLREHGLWED
jgi:uncharacterized protein YfaS (alpha-2-macroglobulin family)